MKLKPGDVVINKNHHGLVKGGEYRVGTVVAAGSYRMENTSPYSIEQCVILDEPAPRTPFHMDGFTKVVQKQYLKDFISDWSVLRARLESSLTTCHSYRERFERYKEVLGIVGDAACAFAPTSLPGLGVTLDLMNCSSDEEARRQVYALINYVENAYKEQ